MTCLTLAETYKKWIFVLFYKISTYQNTILKQALLYLTLFIHGYELSKTNMSLYALASNISLLET
jgi:hypothetical protein